MEKNIITKKRKFLKEDQYQNDHEKNSERKKRMI